jgi:hypothetical protein
VILFFADGTQIRGDMIVCATLRSDLAPIPMTLELDIRAGEDSVERQLAQDQLLTTAAGDKYRIVKSGRVQSKDVQGDYLMTVMRVTALLDACHSIAFVRSRAIVKERASLSTIYRAGGASVKTIDADFPVPRFCCPVGDTPTFHIARVLQEEGGVVRWKGGQLGFARLPDLFKQEPIATVPHNAAEDVESGFLERHEVPWFYSLDAAAGFVYGNRDKPRAVLFAPFKDEQRLRNMTRCLIRRKVAKVPLDMTIGAGELIEFADGARMVVMTAAHVWDTPGDGGAGETYTRMWLGELEG